MARGALHHTDNILDATRTLVLQAGTGGATVEAISRATNAPVGSLYHRFGSRDALLAELWVRAVRRSQAAFLAAAADDDPDQAAVNAALSIHDFAKQNRDDARLVVSFRREDLLRDARSSKLTRDLKDLNVPLHSAVTSLARRLYGRATQRTIQRTLLAVIDIPQGAIRRHLMAASELPSELRDQLAAAVRAVLRP
jgi:AcrR family transcriptional regulator